jgi:hypothetical protein
MSPVPFQNMSLLRYLADVQMPLDIYPVLTRIYLALSHIKSSPLEILFNQVTDLSETSSVSPCIKPDQIIP